MMMQSFLKKEKKRQLLQLLHGKNVLMSYKTNTRRARFIFNLEDSDFDSTWWKLVIEYLNENNIIFGCFQRSNFSSEESTT